MKLLLYCTKAKPFLINDCGKFHLDNRGYNYYWKKGMIAPEHHNGKIVAECDYEVEKIKNKLTNNNSHLELSTDKLTEEELFEKSCLSRYEMFNYLKNGFSKKGIPKGYAIHIKNLNIFDEPKELENYFHYVKDVLLNGGEYLTPIRTAPQNMCRVYELERGEILSAYIRCILISIKPEWLAKILNGKKTIEVRKKILKEMLNDK